jgi:hypothetical protein
MTDAGFETTVTYPSVNPEHKVEYVAVQALGSGGQLLATSATTKVIGG